MRTDRKGAAGRAKEDRHEPTLPKSQKQHPFSGQLVDGVKAADWLIDALSKSEKPIYLCSAFLRSEALHALMPKNRKQYQGRILTRWQPGDLQAGASDLQSYVVAKQLGLKFLIRQDFHGKVFSFPDIGVLVGSANATLAGFGLKENGNAEVCTLVPPLESNAEFIDGLFIGAVEIDDALFDEISLAMKNTQSGTNEYLTWPEELMKKLQPQQTIDRFLASECLVSPPLCDENRIWHITDEHDRKLLGLSSIQNEELTVAARFRTLKLFRWLVERLKRENGEMYFGSVASALHDSLLDNPVVYRRDVKVLVQNLLTWCELFPECGIHVDRPNHSQRIQLIIN